MSTSNDQPVPSLPGDVDERQASADWSDLSTCLTRDDLDRFAEWLDAELAQLESDLEKFVSDGSRYSGRR